MSNTCPRCNGPVTQPARGRKRIYCSGKCKVSVHDKKKREQEAAQQPPRIRREPAPLRWGIGSKTNPAPVKPEVKPEPEVVEPEALIDLDEIPIAQLRGEAQARGLKMDGDRESLIRAILIFDGVELPEDEPEGDEPEPVEALTEPAPGPLKKWMPDPNAPAPAPAPRPRPRVRESW